MLLSSLSKTVRWSLRPPVSGGTRRPGPRRKAERGILGLLLLVLFVAQSSIWSVHGHAAGTDPGLATGLAGRALEAIETADGGSHALAAEPCDVCEMARRIGSESIASAAAPALALPSAVRRAPILRSTRIPASVERAGPAPRAPPLALA